MTKTLSIIAVTCALLCMASCGHYRYETFKGDPMNTKIYTLDNGLKVYMTVDKDSPRLQTYIAVKTGGKTDPSDNTGLAHYLEHIMFKGTPSFGTSDYEAEKPKLDSIEAFYNEYRTLTDKGQRDSLYRLIDSVSYEASRYAIANEYDKLMSIIGSDGSNAFTSNDVTCYIEDIPSNQIENWAKVQADRFKYMTVRGFHTELEAVYEEYNTGLSNDTGTAIDKIDSMLFRHHPYGTQTVIGTQQHLKNPSISAIKKQKETYYVPNNTAICVSGDFNPDEFVAVVEKYFGDWKPNDNLPQLSYEEEEPITSPVTTHAYGNEDEFLLMGWRTPGSSKPESATMDIVSRILYNGTAGLIDLDIIQQQKALALYTIPYERTDHAEFLVLGYPKAGQTLEDVRDLVLTEFARLRNGDFDETLVKAAIANYKLDLMRSYEHNSERAMKYVDSFINGHDWATTLEIQNSVLNLTKEDIVAWANTYLGAESYAAVYKHTGINTNIHKIEAPKITPILTNRDKQSNFLRKIQECEVAPIEPVFADFNKDMDVDDYNGLELLYKKNETNDYAQLSFIFDKGLMHDPALSLAFDYLSYLSTSDKSAEELATEMYTLACEHGERVGNSSTSIIVSGLNENLGDALDIINSLYSDAVGDDDILEMLKADIFKSREDSKLSQNAIFSALRNYMIHGADFVNHSTLTNKQISALTSDELLARVKDLMGKAHKICYYGPASKSEVMSLLAGHHKTDDLEPLVKEHAHEALTPEPVFYIVNYDAPQFNYFEYSNRGETFDLNSAAPITLFNEYFGGGMNGIVFQEMRESKALAYHAGASLGTPDHTGGNYYFCALINSQNDKLQKAVEAFDDIINNMPEEEKNFEIAKTSLDSRFRTSRTTGREIFNSYLESRELGLDAPLDKYVYEGLAGLTMDDLKEVQKTWVKNRTYVYGIVGNAKDLDLDYLKGIAPVKILSIEEVFGY